MTTATATATKNDVLIIHVWPEPDAAGRVLLPHCTPITDEREADVWDKLRSLTTNPAVRRNILVLTRSKQGEAEVMEQFRLDDCNEDRIRFAAPVEIERTKWNARTKSRKTIKEAIPLTLSNATDAKVVADLCLRSNEVSALLVWHPEEYPADWQGWDSDLKHLSYLKERNVRTPIYIFHNDVHPDKWGVEIDGDQNRAYRKNGNWQDEFPPLADVKPEPLEMVVENFLIKGNIHVAAGRHETYKTMALIEMADAILSERPVFDEFKVTHRYPVLFLCPDMSSYLFDDYAAPFNLRAYGADFRVQKGDIIPAVNSPTLQAAVKGRILILDTMLDFANIKELGQSGEWITFMQQLRELITVHGCVAIVMTAHANKPGAKAATIDSSDYLKDSVTFGGKVDVAYGFKAVAGTSQILVERIKGRGFKKPLKFTITLNDENGDSYLDRGRFPVCQKPGEVKIDSNKGGRPPAPDKQAMLEFLSTQKGSYREMAEALKEQFPGTTTSKDTVKRWMEEGQNG